MFLFKVINDNCIKSSINHYKILEEYISDSTIVEQNFDSKDELKYILLWTKFFGDEKWGLPQGTNDQRFFEEVECPETKCVVTNDKSLRNVSSYEAIVFHGAETWFLQNPPKVRSPRQIYAFASMESPAETKHNLELDQNFYNITSE